MCYYTSDVACPYFLPSELRVHGLDRLSAMLPLGDSWTGVCTADPSQPWPPGENALRACNLGYARGACSRFPDDQGPDAVRFAIRGDDGRCVSISWVAERDHHPFAHGSLEYSLAGRCFRDSTPRVLAGQARAYVESYLLRKSEAFSR